jgi:hypothetical protein
MIRTAATRPRRVHNRRMLDSVSVACPFCGEPFETTVDTDGGSADYIEDCPVCCRPIRMRTRVDADGRLQDLQVSRDD